MASTAAKASPVYTAHHQEELSIAAESIGQAAVQRIADLARGAVRRRVLDRAPFGPEEPNEQDGAMLWDSSRGAAPSGPGT
jgi:hypothetical protein